MTSKRTGRTMKPRKGTTPKNASILDRLAPAEAQTVLHRLLAAHEDLRPEAEQAARGLLGEVSFESVANDVESALHGLDLDDLGSRAGRHSGGYTSPTEAAWELLHEAAEPFVSDMKRQIELGLDVEALEICKGILLGLYRIRGSSGDEFLGWAEDFPSEAADEAVSTWGERGVKNRARPTRARNRLEFPQEFVNEHLPDWDDLIARALGRK